MNEILEMVNGHAGHKNDKTFISQTTNKQTNKQVVPFKPKWQRLNQGRTNLRWHFGGTLGALWWNGCKESTSYSQSPVALETVSPVCYSEKARALSRSISFDKQTVRFIEVFNRISAESEDC